MAQQQAPEVGTVLDGYRFNGGDPKQEASWEQVAPIAAPEYGPGAQRLPNGAVVRYGPRGGMDTIVSAAQASAAGNGAESSPMVGADARARFMINLGPLQAAQANLERMDAEGYDPSSLRNLGAAALEAVPFDGGFAARAAGGGEYNAYNQAAKTFEAAIMPIMSGAAVTPTEAQRMIRAALPQPGDSPDVLAQKSSQRRMMINAVAQGIGQAAPYEITPPGTDESGNNLRIRDLTPDETPEALAASGRIRGEDGVWRYRRDEQGNPIIPESGGGQPPAGPSGGDNGGLLRPQSEAQVREQTAADRSASGEGFFRKADAAVRGAADMLTFGLSDEIAAGLDTVIPLNGGQAGWANGFPSAYRHNLARERGATDADAADVPVSRGAGQVAGGLMFAPRAAAGAAGRGLVANTVRGTGAGIGYGGAYGFGSGEGNALERAPDAAVGAGWGAVGGAVAPSLMNVAGRVISPAINAFADGARTVGRPVVNALGDRAPQFLQDAVAPNALTRGLERFAGTNRPDVNALNARRVQLEGDVGRPVAAASTINTGGRAMLRALGTRSDAARETAENFGQGTAEALPARIGGQARRILSNDTRSPDDIRTAIRTERRNTARTTYAEPYAQPVTIDDGLTEALRGPTGRASIQRARADAEANQEWATVADLDRMAEASGGAGGPFPQVSAAAVDYIRQAMSGRGRALSSRPGGARRGAGFQGRADQVDAALENVEGLGPARAAYRDSSRQIEAVDAGERFMGNTPDTVAAAMRDAPESAQAPFRAAAARSIERAAGTTGAAPGVAQRLAIPGTPQRQMMDETLGPDTAQRLAAAARGERDVYRGAQQVDPGVGSQTTNNAMKAMDAAGAVGDLAAGRPLGAVRRVIGMLDSRGFNPQQAEAVLEAMTDPSRADEVIGILADRMSRREARRLTRALRYQLTITPQSGQQP